MFTVNNRFRILLQFNDAFVQFKECCDSFPYFGVSGFILATSTRRQVLGHAKVN